MFATLLVLCFTCVTVCVFYVFSASVSHYWSPLFQFFLRLFFFFNSRTVSLPSWYVSSQCSSFLCYTEVAQCFGISTVGPVLVSDSTLILHILHSYIAYTWTQRIAYTDRRNSWIQSWQNLTLIYQHPLFLCIGSIRRRFWLPPEETLEVLLLV